MCDLSGNGKLMSVERAAEAILENLAAEVDLAKVTFANGDTVYSINIIDYPAEVLTTANKMRFLGNMMYKVCYSRPLPFPCAQTVYSCPPAPPRHPTSPLFLPRTHTVYSLNHYYCLPVQGKKVPARIPQMCAHTASLLHFSPDTRTRTRTDTHPLIHAHTHTRTRRLPPSGTLRWDSTERMLR